VLPPPIKSYRSRGSSPPARTCPLRILGFHNQQKPGTERRNFSPSNLVDSPNLFSKVFSHSNAPTFSTSRNLDCPKFVRGGLNWRVRGAWTCALLRRFPTNPSMQRLSQIKAHLSSQTSTNMKHKVAVIGSGNWYGLLWTFSPCVLLSKLVGLVLTLVLG
jgi:hypothetical protein